MEAWLERVDWNWEREPVRTARWERNASCYEMKDDGSIPLTVLK